MKFANLNVLAGNLAGLFVGENDDEMTVDQLKWSWRSAFSNAIQEFTNFPLANIYQISSLFKCSLSESLFPL